jgi:hypothetical protein
MPRSRCCAATGAPSQHLTDGLVRLGDALGRQYEADGRVALLDEMVAVDEQLVALTKPDDPERAQRMCNLAYGLRRRYERGGDPVALDRAVDLLRWAAEHALAANTDRVFYLLELLVVLRTRFERLERRADLEEAVHAARLAVEHARTPAVLARMQTALAEVLEMCHQRWGDPGALDEALRNQRASAAATPVHTLAFAVGTGKLVRILLLMYTHHGSRPALDEAVTTLVQCLSHVSEPDGRRLLCELLDRAYRLLYEETSDPDVLDRWVEAARSALDSDGTDVGHLNHLAIALYTRFRRAGDPGDLEEALRRNEAALAGAADDDPGLPVLLSAQSGLLYSQYERTGHAVILAESVRLGRQAAARLAAPDDKAIGVSNNLVTVLMALAGEASAPADLLEEAVGVARGAVASARHETERADAQALLARTLRARYEHGGSHPDLDEAIEVARASARTAEACQPTQRVSRYITLEQLLSIRHELEGRAVDLDDAIAATDAALEVPTIGSPDRARRLMVLAGLLQRRFDESSNRADLDRAITAGVAAGADPDQIGTAAGPLRGFSADLLQDRLRWAAERSTYDAAVEAAELSVKAANSEQERMVALNRLATVLWQRSQVTGTDQDLADALAITRRVVAGAKSADRSVILLNLATQLGAMFEATGHTELLDESIQAARKALHEAEPDDPGIPGYLNGVANGLRRRFRQSGDPMLLLQANTLARDAVAITLPGDAHRPGRLANLAAGLAQQAEADHAPVILDEAIEIAREAVRTVSEDEVSRATLLYGLGDLLLQRHRNAGEGANSTDIDEAVDLMRSALALLPAGDRRLPDVLLNLGITLSTRFRSSHREADLLEALADYERVANDVLAPPPERIRAAVLWGLEARASSRASEAVRSFSTAVRLLPDLVPRHLLRRDQERSLANLGGLAGFAAASALEVGDPDLAVVLLEQARGVLLAQSFESRGDVSELRERYPDIAEEFEARRRLLNAVDDLAAVPSEEANATEERIAARRARVEAWRAFLEEIRQKVPGFDQFLLPPTASALRLAAREGPVVMPTVGERGSTALVLTPAEVRVVPLPDLTTAAVLEMVRTFFAAIRAAQADERSTARRAEESILGVLNCLWTLLAAPVLDDLGHRGRPPADASLERVWWVPSGALSFLPIHAAGDHRRRGHPEAPTVMDRVVSSYSPTVRTLLEMRLRRERAATPSGLVVALSQTPGEHDLPGVRREVERISTRLRDAVVLPGRKATHGRIVGELERAAWVHFACHGVSYPGNPSHSRLLVYDHQDHPLTVLDISRLHLTGAEFAFLSACTTAQPTSALTDEAIHLTSAFQLAGFRHVIGTLWSVNDAIAVRMADQVYGQLTHGSHLDPAQSARALHLAVDQIRSRAPDRPSAWAAYIHAGI